MAKKQWVSKVKLCNCRKWKLRPSFRCAWKHLSFLWLLSQQLLQDCSLAASEVDLGEHEVTALASLIYWTYSVVTALASLLVANKGTFYGADASERFVYASTLHSFIARNSKGWISWQKLYLWALSLNRNYFL